MKKHEGPREDDQKSTLAARMKKQSETGEALARLVKLMEGKNSSLKQTRTANEKAEDEAWERHDEIAGAATMFGKAAGIEHADGTGWEEAGGAVLGDNE